MSTELFHTFTLPPEWASRSYRFVRRLVPTNVRAVSDARFLEGAKLGRLLCARSIQLTPLCRPNRSNPGCIPIVGHSVKCVTLIELGADFVDVGESEGSPG